MTTENLYFHEHRVPREEKEKRNQPDDISVKLNGGVLTLQNGRQQSNLQKIEVGNLKSLRKMSC